MRSFIESLQNEFFSEKDKKRLYEFIEREQTRGVGKPLKKDQHMGYFVSIMFQAFQQTRQFEAPVRLFIDIVSKYFIPDKSLQYDSIDISIVDTKRARQISLEDLSSGEKQIFAVFAYLLFLNSQNFVVLIDEPELSLSVPWQRSFLTDILATERCKQLIAVTHSPFIFDNALNDCVHDVGSLVHYG